MPPILALLPAIIGAAGLGEGIYSAVSQPGPQKPPIVTPSTPAPSPTQIQQGTSAAQTSDANSQANTGQGLSPGAIAALQDQLYQTPG